MLKKSLIVALFVLAYAWRLKPATKRDFSALLDSVKFVETKPQGKEAQGEPTR
jgi:hypothetical protein